MGVPLKVNPVAVGVEPGASSAKSPESLAVLAAVAPLISAGVGVLGDFIGGKRQEDFQERMSNTSYQRGVQDMMRAGINPLLAYSQGGASSPSGALIQPGRSISEAGSSAARLSIEQRVKNATVENLEKSNNLLDKQTEYYDALRGKTQYDANTSFWEQAKAEWMSKFAWPTELEMLKSQAALVAAQQRESSARAQHGELALRGSEWESEYYKGLQKILQSSGPISWDDVKRLGLGIMVNYMRGQGYDPR